MVVMWLWAKEWGKVAAELHKNAFHARADAAKLFVDQSFQLDGIDHWFVRAQKRCEATHNPII